MKISKIIGSALLVLASAYSYANHHIFNFSGQGEWKSLTCAHKGTYSVEVKVEKHLDGMTLFEQYRFSEDKTMEVVLRLTEDENGLMTVYKNNEVVGEGYCFEGEGKKTCHLDYQTDGMHVEKTIHKVGMSVFRLGSIKGEHKHLKFRDKLELDMKD